MAIETSASERLKRELQGFRFCFPIMDRLGEFLDSDQNNHLRGKVIGWHCHLTSITAATAQVMVTAGVRLFLSECNPHTTDHDSVSYMQSLGAQVFTGAQSVEKVLASAPVLTSDTGFVLTRAAIAGGCLPFAGNEITSSGVSALRALPAVPMPVININDGQLKHNIENFHGVGDGVIDALFKLTGRVWSGRPVAVLGYGRVGAGVARYLQQLGAVVAIVEVDPVRQLMAHYDGFALTSLAQALPQCELLITASGSRSPVPEQLWHTARPGMVVLNVAHFASELDSLKETATAVTPFSEHLERVQLEGTHVLMATSGSPANVVMLTGSAEPCLIHLTTEMLSLNYLGALLDRGESLPAGEHKVPYEVERQSSLLALAALDGSAAQP
ncbi:MAG: NAD(P)-dependent oxidoreductase [Candidatus Obscuribacterales bacterium]